MVDKELIENRLLKLEQILRKLNDISKSDREEFINSEALQDRAERNLQLAAQICIDIGNHIISDEGYRFPSGYSDIFQVLKEEKILDDKLSETMKKIAGFRNVLVHDYVEIDKDMVYSTLNNIYDFKKFAEKISKFL